MSMRTIHVAEENVTSHTSAEILVEFTKFVVDVTIDHVSAMRASDCSREGE